MTHLSRSFHPRRHRFWLALGLMVTLGGCGKDPMGPENRMALLAFGQCQYERALELTDFAIEQGSDKNAHRALLLQAAIYRDLGQPKAAEALYPAITTQWAAMDKGHLSGSKRERDIQLMLDIALEERRLRELPADCAGVDSVFDGH